MVSVTDLDIEDAKNGKFRILNGSLEADLTDFLTDSNGAPLYANTEKEALDHLTNAKFRYNKATKRNETLPHAELDRDVKIEVWVPELIVKSK